MGDDPIPKTADYSVAGAMPSHKGEENKKPQPNRAVVGEDGRGGRI